MVKKSRKATATPDATTEVCQIMAQQFFSHTAIAGNNINKSPTLLASPNPIYIRSPKKSNSNPANRLSLVDMQSSIDEQPAYTIIDEMSSDEDATVTAVT